MEIEECDTTLSLAIGSNNPKKVHIIKPEKHVNLCEILPTQFNEEKKRDKMVKNECKIRKLRSHSRNTDSDEKSRGEGAKKKLRLSNDQLTLLESIFQENNILNPMLKQELAYRLGLRTRQVEVWFQNRRARNKMKQTEASKEILKRHCERITVENRRMKNELQELKLMTFNHNHNFLKPPKLNICKHCREIT